MCNCINKQVDHLCAYGTKHYILCMKNPVFALLLSSLAYLLRPSYRARYVVQLIDDGSCDKFATSKKVVHVD